VKNGGIWRNAFPFGLEVEARVASKELAALNEVDRFNGCGSVCTEETFPSTSNASATKSPPSSPLAADAPETACASSTSKALFGPGVATTSTRPSRGTGGRPTGFFSTEAATVVIF